MKFLRSIYKVILGMFLVVMPLFIYLMFNEEPLIEPEYDVELGLQTVMSIQEDPVEYPILPKEEYPEAYAYMAAMVEEIVNSPEVQYRDIFKYKDVKIINRDDVLNAFCVPGGYVYVYTGIIKYMDHPDHLAGVLGHEIAHAEKRHSTIRLQKEYGKENIFRFLILSGSVNLSGAIAVKMAKDLTSLDYSRGQEAEADEWSVRYLRSTPYACNGAAGFFEKIIEEGNDVAIPEFLSDHPDSAARVRDINGLANNMGCSQELMDVAKWRAFQKMLPSNKETKPAEGTPTGPEEQKEEEIPAT